MTAMLLRIVAVLFRKVGMNPLIRVRIDAIDSVVATSNPANAVIRSDKALTPFNSSSE